MELMDIDEHMLIAPSWICSPITCFDHQPWLPSETVTAWPSAPRNAKKRPKVSCRKIHPPSVEDLRCS